MRRFTWLGIFLSHCLVCVALVQASVVLAQTTKAADPSAELIEAVSKRLLLTENVEGDFVQRKSINALPQPLVSKGDFSYKRDVGLVWTTREPIESQLVFDAKGIEQSVDGESVWTMDAQQPLALALTQVMTGVLSANWQVLKEYFFISGSIDDQSWTLTMIPTDKTWEKVVTELRVTGNLQLEAIVMSEPSGDKTAITIKIHEQTQP